MIICGDALTELRKLPDESVHCCVTSPPYWGLRDYGTAGQLGLEKTPEEYVAKLVEVFREVKRVLRKDGTLWLNLGDSYSGSHGTGGNPGDKQWTQPGSRQDSRPDVPPGLKPKDLVGIPWRVAFALQADGWYLRSDIIWAKPNPMPESVTDRPTKSHEYIFLMSKNAKYYFDQEAVKELALSPERGREKGNGESAVDTKIRGHGSHCGTCGSGRNLRSVWTITTKPFKEAHFATFPPELPERCIKAGTSEKGCCPECGSPWERVVDKSRTFESGSGRSGNAPIGKNGPDFQGDIRLGPCIHTTTIGWQPTCSHNLEPIPCVVLDPFFGAGTVGLVAKWLGREFIGIELNPAYCEMAEKRIDAQAMPLPFKSDYPASPSQVRLDNPADIGERIAPHQGDIR